MIDHRTIGPWEPIFTFVANDGSNVSIHSGRLRQEVLRRKPHVSLYLVDEKIARSYVADNAVRLDRLKELAKHRDKFDPIIYCEDGFTDGIPDVMLVDGHHRYVVTAALKIPTIKAVLLLKEFWKPFQIVGLSDVSAATLKAIPVHKRNY